MNYFRTSPTLRSISRDWYTYLYAHCIAGVAVYLPRTRTQLESWTSVMLGCDKDTSVLVERKGRHKRVHLTSNDLWYCKSAMVCLESKMIIVYLCLEIISFVADVTAGRYTVKSLWCLIHYWQLKMFHSHTHVFTTFHFCAFQFSALEVRTT